MRLRLLKQILFAAIGLAIVVGAGAPVRALDGCGETFAPETTCSQANCEDWCDAPGCGAAESGHTQNEQGCWCHCVIVP